VKNAQFDEKMVKQVREFQSALGLKADGVVGPVTFMHLNRAAGIEEPRLRNTLAAASATTTE
jgi:general secretion pathway protein A